MSPHEVIDLMELNAEMLAALRLIAEYETDPMALGAEIDPMKEIARAAIAKAERR